jgi:hypothetical protein
MGMINLGSSMRYGPTGKKRKTNAWKSVKKNTIMPHKQGKLKMSLVEQQRIEAIREFDLKYPSYSGPETGNTLVADDSYKKEASKNFTVAIGYNKGSYQVIPKNEIKHIGK